MQFGPAQQDALNDILTWRRDVRHFRNDPIPHELLERLRQAVDMSPSVGNARPWRFVRVCDAGLRAKVRNNFEQANKAASGLYGEKQRAQYLELKLAGLDKAPEQFAVFTDIDPQAGHGLGRQTLPQSLRQSTAMAIHTLWLAARVENLGLGMVSILDPNAIAGLFECPDNWEFSAYLCLGWPEKDDDTPLLHRENWQANEQTGWFER